ncbi:MAG: RAMP superfamily protein [Acidobacteria bacterium]|nr:RAMP superfamily protein [Acidobacteriota bacterium]
MKIPSGLVVELLSDTTFGRGEGTAGAVDVEVEHDRFGCPFLGGKTLRGMLRDSWLSMSPHFPGLEKAAERVLGLSGDVQERSILRVGDAVLGETVRSWIRKAVERPNHPIAALEILEGFTDIRHQTAEARLTGAPAQGTLRASRVVLRGTCFHAPLSFEQPTADDLRCLALAALGVRHGGSARNRGRGHLRLRFSEGGESIRLLARGEAA